MIKIDMDMPKCCEECKLVQITYQELLFMCPLTTEIVEDYADFRHENCPLIECKGE